MLQPAPCPARTPDQFRPRLGSEPSGWAVLAFHAVRFNALLMFLSSDWHTGVDLPSPSSLVFVFSRWIEVRFYVVKDRAKTPLPWTANSNSSAFSGLG